MNWAILATGTIAAKFAETVNGSEGEDRIGGLRFPFPGEGGGVSVRNTEFQDIRFL